MTGPPHRFPFRRSAYHSGFVLAGPVVLGVVTAHDQIDLLARIGVAVLLFAVGLTLDLQHIRHIGPVALTFASTIIIVKLLSDKREIDTPHGRIAATPTRQCQQQ